MSFRPVDLGIPNSIINAYVAGQQIRESKEKLAQQKELEQRKLDLEKQRIEDEHKVAQGHLDILSKAADINRLLSLQQIGAGVTESGQAPPGGQITGVDYGPTGEAPQTISFTHPALGTVPITVESPEARIRRIGQLKEAEEEPKRKTETTVAGMRESAAALLEYQRLIQTSLENEKNRANKIDIANINAQSRLAAAKARGTQDRISRLADTIGQQFNNNQVSKNFEVIKQARNLALNPNSSDYDILHAYGKALDPNTASLPGGELQILQQMPSIAERLGLKFDSLLANKQFLGSTKPQVIKSINSIYQMYEGAYKGARSQAENRLKTIGEMPENWLDDYSKLMPGDVVTVKGKQVTVKAVHPDGSFDPVEE